MALFGPPKAIKTPAVVGLASCPTTLTYAIHESGRHPGREFLVEAVALRARGGGSPGCGSMWTTGLAWSRPERHPRREIRSPGHVCSSTFRDPPERRFYPGSSRPPRVAFS